MAGVGMASRSPAEGRPEPPLANFVFTKYCSRELLSAWSSDEDCISSKRIASCYYGISDLGSVIDMYYAANGKIIRTRVGASWCCTA